MLDANAIADALYASVSAYLERETATLRLEIADLAKIPGEKGQDGSHGRDGLDGADGKDGANGADGLHGKDGLGGRDGADGKDGANGADGLHGKDGLGGRDGADGKDGTNGKDGLAGRNGIDGKDGLNGKDGRDGQDGKDVTDVHAPDDVAELISKAAATLAQSPPFFKKPEIVNLSARRGPVKKTITTRRDPQGNLIADVVEDVA